MQPSTKTLLHIGVMLMLVSTTVVSVQPSFCSAQTVARAIRPVSQTASQSLLWFQIAGMVVAVGVSYAMAFLVTFPRALRSGVGPLTAYGVAWAVFFLACTFCVLLLFFDNLRPVGWTNLTAFYKLYWRHVLVAVIGAVFTILSLVLFRSPSTSK